MQNEAKCVKQNDFPLAFFFSFLTRCILRCFVLESLLCCMNLDFCVVSNSPGSLPEILLFPCVHLSSPESAAQHRKNKKTAREKPHTGACTAQYVAAVPAFSSSVLYFAIQILGEGTSQ